LLALPFPLQALLELAFGGLASLLIGQRAAGRGVGRGRRVDDRGVVGRI
jgi:hypothetical protein